MKQISLGETSDIFNVPRAIPVQAVKQSLQTRLPDAGSPDAGSPIAGYAHMPARRLQRLPSPTSVTTWTEIAQETLGHRTGNIALGTY